MLCINDSCCTAMIIFPWNLLDLRAYFIDQKHKVVKEESSSDEAAATPSKSASKPADGGWLAGTSADQAVCNRHVVSRPSTF